MVQKISTFRRLGLAGAALAMAVAVGVVPTGSASAACEGPADLGQLQVLLDERNDNQNVTLCGNIDGQFTVYRRMTTINLNGYSINSGSEAFARVREQGQITITGAGNVNGRMSGGFNASSFIAAGGTYTDANVANFVAAGTEAYNVGGVYTVEPEITSANFVVSPVDPEEITIRKGQTAQITATLPAGSTSGVTFEADTDGVIEIDENGAITTVGTGYTWVTVTPTYDTSLTKGVYVNVYDIEPVSEPEEEQYEGEVDAAENLAGVIDEGLVDDNGDATEGAETAFNGFNVDNVINQLQEAMSYGEVINTQIYKDEAYLTDSQRAEMAELMDGVSMDNIKFYEIDVDIYRGADWIGGLSEVKKPIRVFIAEATDPEAGYTRKYYMVSYHRGEPELLEEGVDFEIVDGKIYLISNKFSVFALGYKDVLAPVVTTTYSVTAPETGVNTVAEGSASTNASVAVLGAIAAATLGGVAVFAKRK